VWRGTILSGAAGIDISSLRTFLKILSRNGPEYDSNGVDYYSPSRECFHIDGDNLANDASEVMLPDQSPHSHTEYLHEKATCLQSR
jgi:hypothetical protein